MRGEERSRQNCEGMRQLHHYRRGQLCGPRHSRGGKEAELEGACGGEVGGVGGRRKREEAGDTAEEEASSATEDWAAADLARDLPGYPPSVCSSALVGSRSSPSLWYIFL